jgi:hypothetical protein
MWAYLQIRWILKENVCKFQVLLDIAKLPFKKMLNLFTFPLCLNLAKTELKIILKLLGKTLHYIFLLLICINIEVDLFMMRLNNFSVWMLLFLPMCLVQYFKNRVCFWFLSIICYKYLSKVHCLFYFCCCLFLFLFMKLFQ